MRYLFFSAVIAMFSLVGCINNDPKPNKYASVLTDSVNFTTIEWLDSTKDFGKIPEGEKIPVSFRFKNSGPKPLVIKEAHASCGCTVVDKPERPFAPGEQGEIKAIYNSEGHVGTQNKTITVSTNTPETKELKFSLEVVKKQ